MESINVVFQRLNLKHVWKSDSSLINFDLMFVDLLKLLKSGTGPLIATARSIVIQNKDI